MRTNSAAILRDALSGLIAEGTLSRFLSGLSANELTRLHVDFELWARDDQLPPKRAQGGDGDGVLAKDMDFVAAKHVLRAKWGARPRLAADAAWHPGGQHMRKRTAPSGGRLCCRSCSAPPRHCRAWLALAFAGGNAGPAPDTGGLELRPDLDALWQRVRKSDFLTINEKRAAVGYGAVEGGDRLSGVAPEG